MAAMSTEIALLQRPGSFCSSCWAARQAVDLPTGPLPSISLPPPAQHQYFGFGRMLAASGVGSQMRQMAGSSMARGAQVLGFRQPELSEDLALTVDIIAPTPTQHKLPQLEMAASSS